MGEKMAFNGSTARAHMFTESAGQPSSVLVILQVALQTYKENKLNPCHN